MNQPASVYVTHAPGGRLPSGDPNGLGGETTYHVATTTTDGLDRHPVGPSFSDPGAACRYADQVDKKQKEQSA